VCRIVSGGVILTIIVIKNGVILSDVKIGDSIAVNGVCLTVTAFANGSV